MENALALALRRLEGGLDLSPDQAAGAFGEIMGGRAAAADIAALLLGLRAKGETAQEVAGTVQALRAVMVPVRLPEGPAVDTCGTGGGATGTLNISTAAAFVAAAAGVRVAKHGNRSYTSRCGSADLLEALGVPIHLPADTAGRILEEVGMVFLFAPDYHPAMRHVAPVRRALKVATIMNLVGPLANPAGVRRQVVGVAEERLAPLLARALQVLGAERAMVVHGEIGMDEISPVGRTRILELHDGRLAEWDLDPATYDLTWDRPDDLVGGEPAENAERIEQVFEGRGREADRRAVILNAAAAIYVAGMADSYASGIALATGALAQGGARTVLEALRRAG